MVVSRTRELSLAFESELYPAKLYFTVSMRVLGCVSASDVFVVVVSVVGAETPAAVEENESVVSFIVEVEVVEVLVSFVGSGVTGCLGEMTAALSEAWVVYMRVVVMNVGGGGFVCDTVGQFGKGLLCGHRNSWLL